MTTNGKTKIIAVQYVFYFVLLAGLTHAAYIHPAPTFDRYIYAAMVGQQMSGPYPESFLSEDLLHNPLHMAEMFPFYSIKTLYIAAIRVLGIRVVSPLALFLLGAVLLAWVRSPFLAGLLILFPSVYETSHEITPDMLSCLFLVTASWLIATNRNFLGVIVLISSVWVRTDNVIFAGLALLWMTYEQRIKIRDFFVLSGVALGSAFVIHHFGYNWRLTAYYAFVQVNLTPTSTPYYISIRQFLPAVVGGLKATLVSGSPWALLGFAAWKLNTKYKPLILVAGSNLIFHILLFPQWDVRYFLGSFLLVAVAFVTALPQSAPRGPRNGRCIPRDNTPPPNTKAEYP